MKKETVKNIKENSRNSFKIPSLKIVQSKKNYKRKEKHSNLIQDRLEQKEISILMYLEFKIQKSI